jgi:rhomboid family GlyGly-CTERM serine protease
VNHVHLRLKSLNCDGRRGLALAAIVVLLVLLSAGGEHTRALLRYDRKGLAHGQLWRLLSAHLVHLDLRHALLNCLGLALLWALFARDYPPRTWLVIVLGAFAAIDAGLWFADSTVLWYVGSSGALHGVLAAGAIAWLRSRTPGSWLPGVFLVAKLAYEQLVGPLPLSGSDPVVVDAHLYGAVGGAAVAAFLGRRRGWI